jgi:ribosomal protein L10
MRKEVKGQIIDSLVEEINSYPHLYITDASGLNAEDTSALRRLCFEKGIKLVVAKNTLLKNRGALKGADTYNPSFSSRKYARLSPQSSSYLSCCIRK